MCFGKHVMFSEIPTPHRKICQFKDLSLLFFTHLVFKIMEVVSLKVVTKRFIPSSPNPISSIPTSSKFFLFRPFFFRPFQLRPFPIPPNICPDLLPFCQISFSPIFHFAQKPSHPICPFRPMTISPFSHKAPSQFTQMSFF